MNTSEVDTTATMKEESQFSSPAGKASQDITTSYDDIKHQFSIGLSEVNTKCHGSVMDWNKQVVDLFEKCIPDLLEQSYLIYCG